MSISSIKSQAVSTAVTTFLATALLALLALPLAATAQTSLGPVVEHTGTAPTGYRVTFQIEAPEATSMRIRGKWWFSSTEHASTDPSNAAPFTPEQWQPGYFPLQSPNVPSANWPVDEMTKNEQTGIWTYSVPLPSGVFEYQFFPDCDAPASSVRGCSSMTDPANPGWTTEGSPIRYSQIYVPSDPEFGTEDLSWQDDAPPEARGTLTSLTYETPNDIEGPHELVVYTPPGYNPNRATPYPLFVLSHGGGETEIAWPTNGRVQQIVDNLIADGLIQPLVIVMPNGSGLTRDTYLSEITDYVIPFAEKNYNVSNQAEDRAYAGNSAFGGQTNRFLFGDTDRFGYYGPWSPADGAPELTILGPGPGKRPPYAPEYDALAANLPLGIHLAIGEQDLGGNAPMTTTLTERIGMINTGIPFVYFTQPDGHTWAFWRKALYDFLTKVAFRATHTSVTRNPAQEQAIANVSPASNMPAALTGNVQFLVDGVETGNPVAVKNGQAILRNYQGGKVTAVYSGDRFYNASTGDSGG